jgi:hypothetical protein
MPSMSGLPKVARAALISLIALAAGCHHATTPAPAQPPSLAATLVVEFTWVASTDDDLGNTRTVALSGREVSAQHDSRFVSCFGPEKQPSGCQIVDDLSTTSAYTPGPVFDGGATISDAQLGHWVIAASAQSSSGIAVEHTCSVNLDSNRLVTLTITLGVDAGCAVQ